MLRRTIFDVQKRLSLAVDTRMIIDRFSCHVGHNATIKVCAVCSIRNVMVGEESKELPLQHKYIQLLKCDDEDLHTNRHRLACLKLIMVDGEHYRLDRDGFDVENRLVNVCVSCVKALFYSTSTNRLPRQSLAFYDPGIIPARLPKLSLIELLFPKISFIRLSFI